MTDTSIRLDDVARPRDAAISRPQMVMIVLVLGSTYLFNGMDRQMLPALLSQISVDYHLTLAEGGLLSTSFALNIAIFGALSGFCMKRFGRRVTLVAGVFLYSLFTLLTPLADSFLGLAFYRTFTGAGEALHMCAIYSCVGAFFGRRRGAALGTIGAFFGVGAFLGPVLGTWMSALTGSWRTPFYLYGVVGIAIALAVQLAVPLQFSEAHDTEGTEVIAGRPISGPKKVFNANFMIIAVAYALIGTTFFSFAALYASFLRNELHYSVGSAGTALGMYGIGSLGGVVGGGLSDKLRKPGMLAATLVIAVVAHMLFHVATSATFQYLLSLSLGFLITGYYIPRCLSLLQRNVPSSDVGFAVPIGLALFYFPGVIAGYTFGHLAERLGWSASATIMLTLPPLLAFVMIIFYSPSRSRET